MKIYVADSGQNCILELSPGGISRRIPLVPPAVAPRRLLLWGGDLFHSDVFSSTVGRISLDCPHQQETVAVGRSPFDLICFHQNLFVTCADSNSIWKLSGASLVPVSAAPCGSFPIAAAACGNTLCVAQMLCGSLTFFDWSDLSVLRSIPVEGMPLCVQDCPSGVLVGTLLGSGGGAVLRINSDGKVLQGFSLPSPLTCIRCFRHQGKLLAVGAHLWEDCLTVFDPDAMQRLVTFPCGRMPDDICVADSIYVSCMRDGIVAAYSPSGEELFRQSAGLEPRGLAIQP